MADTTIGTTPTLVEIVAAMKALSNDPQWTQDAAVELLDCIDLVFARAPATATLSKQAIMGLGIQIGMFIAKGRS